MPKMPLSYTKAAPDGLPVSVSVVDTATARVWSPSAGAFVPQNQNPPPADELFPLTLVGGPNHPATYVGLMDPAPPEPPEAGQYLIYAHNGTGGPPIDRAFWAEPEPVTTPTGFKFALIVQ